METVEGATGRPAGGGARAADEGMRVTADEAMRMAVEAE